MRYFHGLCVGHVYSWEPEDSVAPNNAASEIAMELTQPEEEEEDDENRIFNKADGEGVTGEDTEGDCEDECEDECEESVEEDWDESDDDEFLARYEEEY